MKVKGYQMLNQLIRIQKYYKVVNCYNLTDQMNQASTTTVTINTGTEKRSLVIQHGDNITEKVNKFIEDYKLPKKMYTIIMQRITQDLHDPLTPTPKSKPKQVPKSFKIDNRSSTSPFKAITPQTTKANAHKTVDNQKQNNKNFSNIANKTQKYPERKSLSPINKTNNTHHVSVAKKIELKPSKTPKKVQANPLKTTKSAKVDFSLNLQKLFRYLIKCNPSHIKILSPEYINLKGMDRKLLSELQQFFQLLEQNEFDIMNEAYFLAKVEELNFKQRLSKKQYEYCYMI